VASGGLGVEGVEDGVLYAPGPEACEPGEVAVARPFAGTLSEPVSLEVSMAPCAGTEGAAVPAPRVTCTWALRPLDPGSYQGALISLRGVESCRAPGGPERSGRQSWEGLRGVIDLPLPEEVGIYRFAASCGVAGEISKPVIESPYFVVYSEPLTVVSPPKESWYSLSACWAGGLGRGESESDVLAALLGGVYEYGRVFWRYGYAHRDEESEGVYEFPLSRGAAGSSTVRYEIEDEALRPSCNASGRCKCRWQGLVAPGLLCDFSDCYVFSDVFHAMAAVMGVGGLRYQAIRGKAGLGFLTVKARSLDPRFPASVDCLERRDACYPYYFNNHSLRLRDGAYYDATFSQTYSSPGAPVALSRAYSGDASISFIGSDVYLRPLGAAYGNWKFYRPTSYLAPPRDEVLSFRGVRFTAVDDDGDGRHERLEARLDVNVLRRGSYMIFGVLSSDGELVADQPDWWTTQPTVGTVTGGEGAHTLEISFSGQEIYQSGIDGNYTFGASCYDEEGLVSQFSVETPRFDSETFGELEAALREGEVEVEKVISRDDREFSRLRIRIPFRVWQAGTYTLEARLAKDGETLAYAGKRDRFERGHFRVDLDVLGENIVASGRDGPYELTVVYYDEHRAAKTSIQHRVEGFAVRDFAPRRVPGSSPDAVLFE
jgi:hypothetical protein